MGPCEAIMFLAAGGGLGYAAGVLSVLVALAVRDEVRDRIDEIRSEARAEAEAEASALRGKLELAEAEADYWKEKHDGSDGRGPGGCEEVSARDDALRRR